MSAMEYFYVNGEERKGPVNSAQLKALAQKGIITPSTTIEAIKKRVPATKVKGLDLAPPSAVSENQLPLPEKDRQKLLSLEMGTLEESAKQLQKWANYLGTAGTVSFIIALIWVLGGIVLTLITSRAMFLFLIGSILSKGVTWVFLGIALKLASAWTHYLLAKTLAADSDLIADEKEI